MALARRTLRRAAQSLSLCGGLLATPVAAAVPGLTLTWQAPSGCPTQQQVEQAVLAGRLEREAAPGRQVFAQVRVEGRSDGTFVADVLTQAPEGHGTRQLEGESCEAIASASAVVLALVLDPQPPAAPVEPAPPPAPPPAREPPPATPRASAYVHVFGGGVLRALPAPAPLFGLGVGMTGGAWDAELLASYSAAQSVDVLSLPGARADLVRFSAQLFGCYAPVRSSTTALEVCAGALYEHLRGESLGISNPDAQSISLLSPALGLRSRVRVLPRLELVLDVLGMARVTRPRFVIGNIGQVHEMPIFSGTFAAGPRFSF